MRTWTFGLWLTLALVFLVQQSCADSPQELVAKADQAVKDKQYDQALEFYTGAISSGPDASTFYKRAGLYLLRGKKQEALSDLNQAIVLNPKFAGAYLKRAKVELGLGQVEAARSDLEVAVALKPNDVGAQGQLARLDETLGSMEQARTRLAAGLPALDLLHTVVAASPDYLPARRLRATAALAAADYHTALEDTMIALKADKHDLDMVAVRAQALYGLDQREAAMKLAAQGLRQDPEHRDLKRVHGVVRRVERAMAAAATARGAGDWPAALAALADAHAADPANTNIAPHIATERCRAYLSLKQAKEAIAACDHALSYGDSNTDALLLKADALMMESDWDRAYHTYGKVLEHDRGNQRAHEGQQTAQRRQKEASRKDYYKILGLERTATAKDIKKAYRNLALEYHPDKQSEDGKAAAEQMYLDIGEAYEVLSDDELRAKYDRGEDIGRSAQPQQQQQGFHGFQGFQGFQGFHQQFHQQGFNFQWG